MRALNLTNTRRALAVFDAGIPERDRMIAVARTEKETKAWLEAEREALQLVQEAFFADTSDRNSRDHCRLVDIKWLRSLCAKHTEATT